MDEVFFGPEAAVLSGIALIPRPTPFSIFCEATRFLPIRVVGGESLSPTVATMGGPRRLFASESGAGDVAIASASAADAVIILVDEGCLGDDNCNGDNVMFDGDKRF